MFRKERYLDDELWYDKDGNAYKPHQQYFVGGNTKFYGAILFRLRERDFEQVRHYGGISPAWPISYDDLEPYYAEAERLYLVHGQAGEDPTEPWRSGPFPYPAVSHEPRIQQLSDDFERTGHHPFHLPGRHRPERVRPGGRPLRALRPVRRLPLPDRRQGRRPRALRAPRARGAREPEADHPREGGAAGDRPRRPLGHRASMSDRRGAPESYSADIVVVSCGATNSAALLLKSASDRHPRGLANSSDVVGRHYMAHINSGVIAISQTPNTTKFQKTLGINDYYWGAEDSELPLGHIQMLAKSDKDILRAGAPWFAPGLALDYIAKHAIDFWMTTEDLPAPGQPRHRRPPGSHPRRQDLPQPRTPQAAAGQAQAADGAARAATKPRSPAGRSSTSGSRWPATRTSAGRSASAPIPSSSALDRQLPRPRPRQPVRGRHELLPLEQRGQPGADRDGQRAARRRPPARAARRARRARRGNRKATPSRWRSCHEDRREGRQQHRQGAGRRVRRHRRDDDLEHARGQAPRARAKQRARPRHGQGARHRRVRGRRRRKRGSTTSPTGATAPDGESSAGCSTPRACLPAKATAAHGAAVWGSAQVTLPALDIAPPAIFWPKEEIAIDAFHHTVYALATGIAYELLSSGDGA